MRLVVGVAAFNLVLLAGGYAVLSAALRGSRAAVWASYAGVALLVGAGVVGTAAFFAYMLGAPNGLLALAGGLAAAAALGLAANSSPSWRRWLAAPAAPGRPAPAAWESVVETALFTIVAVVAVAALVGGFRSSPWLDDVWGIWVPKGVALDRLGLDARLFAPNGRYETFGVLHYPLWWSTLTGIELRFVGRIDLRAVNAESTLLVLGFLGSVTRLLWGYVRPWLLAGSLLLLAASPELFRHAQGGLADLPVAIYLTLCTACALAWITAGRGFHLVLAAVFGATAVQVKSEALPELVIIAVFVLLLGWRLAPRRLTALAIALAVALASAVPWLAWRAAHNVQDEIPVTRAFDPAYLAGRTGRIWRSVETFARHLVQPRDWLIVVPLALVLALVVAVRERRLAWLSPWFLLGALFAFWVWVYWAHPDRLDFILSTSSYRVADTTVLLAWIAVPVLAERLLRP